MTPDYEKYSISQLLDAKKHIDKDAYPNRYEAILKQLEEKMQRLPENSTAPVNQDQEEKPETQFGLVVIRFSIFWLLVCKLLSLLLVYYFFVKLYDGYVLDQVVSRGNARALKEDPVSYYVNMLYYGVFALFGFWYLTFGSKLQR